MRGAHGRDQSRFSPVRHRRHVYYIGWGAVPSIRNGLEDFVTDNPVTSSVAVTVMTSSPPVTTGTSEGALYRLHTCFMSSAGLLWVAKDPNSAVQKTIPECPFGKSTVTQWSEVQLTSRSLNSRNCANNGASSGTGGGGTSLHTALAVASADALPSAVVFRFISSASFEPICRFSLPSDAVLAAASASTLVRPVAVAVASVRKLALPDPIPSASLPNPTHQARALAAASPCARAVLEAVKTNFLTIFTLPRMIVPRGFFLVHFLTLFQQFGSWYHPSLPFTKTFPSG